MINKKKLTAFAEYRLYFKFLKLSKINLLVANAMSWNQHIVLYQKQEILTCHIVSTCPTQLNVIAYYRVVRALINIFIQ